MLVGSVVYVCLLFGVSGVLAVGVYGVLMVSVFLVVRLVLPRVRVNDGVLAQLFRFSLPIVLVLFGFGLVLSSQLGYLVGLEGVLD